MTDKQKVFKIKSNSFRDLIVILIVVIFALVASYFFNIFSVLVEFFQKNPGSIIWIDEIVMGFLTLIIGLIVFSWRRWRELKIETAQRLRLQNELVNIAETKAETERIICKQLHCEIAEYKKIEKVVQSNQAKVNKQL